MRFVVCLKSRQLGTDKHACIDWSGQLPVGRQPGSNVGRGYSRGQYTSIRKRNRVWRLCPILCPPPNLTACYLLFPICYEPRRKCLIPLNLYLVRTLGNVW